MNVRKLAAAVLVCVFAYCTGQAAASERLVKQPDKSVGFHQHKEDKEICAIVSGTGSYLYEDGECPAKSSNVFVTHKDMYHGLKNLSTDTPLVYFAVPAKPNLTEAGKAAEGNRIK
ncbi:MAG: cupin domain-containing protein [Synergistaceae bacterium]|nr:cupin domain-containing protein [Synergistaceae bacterium]